MLTLYLLGAVGLNPYCNGCTTRCLACSNI